MTMPVDVHRTLNERPGVTVVPPSMVVDRLDAQPFQPAFLENLRILISTGLCKRIAELLRSPKDLTGGATPLGANYCAKGVRFIRTQNVTPDWIQLEDLVFISARDHSTLRRSALQLNDVLLTITGALYGQSAVVRESCLPANISQHSARMHFRGGVDPYYISLFLNSRYGQSEIHRQQVGATRSAIDYEGVKRILVPLPLHEIQEYIGTKVRLAEKCREEAGRLDGSCLQTLLREVGVDLNVGIPTSASSAYQVSFRKEDSFAQIVAPQQLSDRLDPIGYHPELLDTITKLHGATCPVLPLGELGGLQTSQRASASGSACRAFVSILHVDAQGHIDWKEAMLHSPQTAGTEVSPGDVLISKINPKQSRVCAVTPSASLGRMGCSGEFAVFVPVAVGPNYLSFALRSEYCFRQLVHMGRGTSSSRRRIHEDDLPDVLVPVVPSHGSLEVDLRRASALRALAPALVDEAKADVEALIEGKLDTEGILSGRIRPPTWEEMEEDIAG